MILIGIFRELSKLIMFAAIWGLPLYLLKVTGSYSYLWFFVMSALFTIGMFSHYEELEKIDRINDLKKLQDGKNV